MEALIHNFFNWAAFKDSIPFLLSGLGMTLELSALSLGFALVLGLLVAVLRHSAHNAINWLLVVYVDVLRAIPPLVLLIFVFYALPYLGLELSPFPAAVVSFSLYESAYIAEIWRSAIGAIPAGQSDAARALGLTYWQTLKHVILLQAFRIAIPALTGEAIGLVKLTSLAFVVALSELLHEARVAQGFTANSTPLIAAAMIYLILLTVLSRLTGLIELYMQRSLPHLRFR